MAGRESKIGLTAAEIKSSELYGKLTRAKGEGAPFPDTEILRKLFAAEDFYERNLQLTFKPTRVFSNPRLRANAADPYVKVTDFDPAAHIEEPAYDYERGLFDDERWAQMRLGHRPIISVDKAFFWYPGTAIGSSWKLQVDWTRVDYQTGLIEIVPASGQLLQFLSVNSYVVSAIAGGRSVPQSIFIDYTTGFETGVLQAKHQDLIDGVRLLALLFTFGILTTVRAGGQTGGSLSMDGLSHSRSFGGKYGAYSGEIELAIQNEAQIRENWLDHQQGPLVEFA